MSAHASVVFIFAFRRAVCCLLSELALQIFDVGLELPSPRVCAGGEKAVLDPCTLGLGWELSKKRRYHLGVLTDV